MDVRNEGLPTLLDNTKKRFPTLAKMGYKAGIRLGEDNTGRAEPVEVVVKVGMEGLGREAAMKEEKCKFFRRDQRSKLM